VADPVRRVAVQLDLRTRLALQSNVLSGPPGSRIFGDIQDALDLGAIDVATDPTAWWGAEVLHIVEGDAGQARRDAAAALERPLPEAIRSMVCSVMGLSCFVVGDFGSADENLGEAERLGIRARHAGPDKPAPWVASMVVSAPTIRAAAATLVGDRDRASEHLERARGRAAGSVPEQVLVGYFSAWMAAQDGEPGDALEAARVAEELGRRLGDTFYVPMSRVMLGWAVALLGDEDGVAVARDAYAQCAVMGLRFQASVHLLLCAEAHAHHGQLEQARTLARESQSMSQLHGERTLSARLVQLSDRLLAEP
jgi:hypothetical protein